MKLLVAGAAGFVGRAVVDNAVSRGWAVTALVRREESRFPPGVGVISSGDISVGEVPESAFRGIDAVVNCVARVHVMRETLDDPEAAYRAVNVEVAAKLLRAAAAAGVSRFVQISSVAAITSRTEPGAPVDDSFAPDPASPYGKSKLEADRLLHQLGHGLGISVVSIRPPSVFGPGVRAYFAMLMRCARIGLPLPLGAIDNRRSFIYLANLADAVAAASASDEEGAFIVTDSQPVSTAQLYRALLRLYDRPVIVPDCPAGVVRALARTVLGGRAESLIGDAAYDGARFARVFGWAPQTPFDQAIARTVAAK